MEKGLASSSATMLVLKLLEDKDMYGYQMMEELSRRSDQTFTLKAGTLYPILHSLEKSGMVVSYDANADGARVRKYYRITSQGRKASEEKQSEWSAYAQAIRRVLNGGADYAVI